MATSSLYDIIIIGSGPAGLTAGIYASRARLKTLILQGNKPGGQLIGTTYVNNWPGDTSVLGVELMMRIEQHARTMGSVIVAETVTRVDFGSRPYTIYTNKNNSYQAHAIIVATGSLPRMLKCPGEEEYWGRGVSSCAVCDAALYQDKKVIIVGGGDSAMEYVAALARYTRNITIVHILEALTAAPVLQQRLRDYPFVTIKYLSTISEIHGDTTHVTGVTITHVKNNTQEQRAADGVFLAIGLNPNTKVFEGHLELDRFGYVVAHKHTQTSVEGIFTAGDVHDARYRQAITSAGTGCMAALDAERYLVEHGLATI